MFLMRLVVMTGGNAAACSDRSARIMPTYPLFCAMHSMYDIQFKYLRLVVRLGSSWIRVR